MASRKWNYLNTQWLESIASDNAGFINELLELFTKQCEEVFPILTGTMDTYTLDQLPSLLHKLRGSAASIGFTTIPDHLNEVEKQIKQGANGQIATDLCYDLSIEIREAIDEMNEYLSAK